MRTHAKNAVVGGGLVPVVLAAAAAVGNASQQALDLNLQGIALAIYLVGFVAAAALVTAISLKVEGQKAIASLGTPEGLDAIGDLAKAFGLGDLFGGGSSTRGSSASSTPPAPPFPPSTSPAIAPPPPPPAEPAP